LILPLNDNQLTNLIVSNNNLPEQDLSIFSRFVNLEKLKIDNGSQDDKSIKKINQGIYNRFVGSLRPLQNLTKLKELYIDDTDIDSGLEYLPDSIETFWFFIKEGPRPTSKVKAIARELIKYGNPGHINLAAHLQV